MDSVSQTQDYMRSVDFQTGETTVHWADTRGIFERRLFVSRADSVVVLLITGPGKGKINCRFELVPRQVDAKLGAKTVANSNEVFTSHINGIKKSAEKSTLTYKNNFTLAYPGSIHALEGMAHIIAKGGATTPDGETLVVTGADQVLVFIDVHMIYDPDKSQFEIMKNKIAGLPVDYMNLLERHAVIHGGIFNRMKLDLGGGKDHLLTTEELFTRSTNEQLNKALIEKEFDAGRYNILSSTGELPPTLQGLWGGTYVPGWASDYTHNGNVPSAIASIMRGNMPELMLAYTSYIESIVPWIEINARNIFGARGVVLPSRSTTNGFNNSLARILQEDSGLPGHHGPLIFSMITISIPVTANFSKIMLCHLWKKQHCSLRTICMWGRMANMFFPRRNLLKIPLVTLNSQGTFNATMDVAAAKELLQNIISASRVLGVNNEKIPFWTVMLEKMPPYLINDDGAVKEWLTPLLKIHTITGTHQTFMHFMTDYPMRLVWTRFCVMPSERS